MALNVNRSIADAYYRYKMPKIVAKVEGKGNGIKTVVVNMVDVAKSLARPPTYPCKFFGCELGAQTQFDFKNERYIVNGSHEASKLQDLLDIFIQKFVLCPGCDNPETVLKAYAKKQVISQTCMACGYNGMLNMTHKLTTFILKNPPEQAVDASGTNVPTPHKKGGKKGKADNEETNNHENDDHGGSPEKITEVDPYDDWSVDVSDAAVAARQREVGEGIAGLTINADLERTEKERVDLFFEYIRKKKDEGKITKTEKDIVVESERLDIRDKAPLILSELLLDQDIIKQLKKYRTLLLRFTVDNKRAQKSLLGGIECIIQLHSDALLPKVSVILKVLYDLDIVEEETILDWGKKVSKKHVSKEVSAAIHEKATPFLKWLQEAEEDSDDSDEDAVEIEYDDRARSTELTAQAKQQVKQQQEQIKQKQASPVEEEGVDDVDIDAI